MNTLFRAWACFVTTLMTFGLGGLPAGHAALVAQWHFDESTGTTARDSAGSFHGALSATGASFTPGGISGNAVNLDRATSGFVTMGNVLPLTSGDFSVVVWVKTTTTQTDTLVLAKHESGSANGYFFAINQTGGGGAPNKATFVASESVAQEATSASSVNDGNWHQIVGVYQSVGSEFIYVDGAPAEATGLSKPVVINNAPFLVGGFNISGTPQGRYTGLVDEVQIYDQALTASDVDFLFQHPASSLQSTLEIQLAGTNVVLKWPSFMSNFVLQATIALGAPGSWITLTNVLPVAVGSNLTVTEPAAAPAKFYRLKK